MCSDRSSASPELAIAARGVGKSFALYENPVHRLLQLFGLAAPSGRQFHALQNIDFEVRRGEVVGIVGRNGAGKSTLLQMICGTLPPSTGHLQVQGRIAALLELGAGFNPDFTGRENVYLNGTILGLSREEIDSRLADILAFADIGDFVDQPVKTYSSGMFVRLAFAVAVSVDPEILIIDEALSVGDGAFARKSFDRIMQLKEAGKTILFCSHSMYQVEALCSRALWIEKGQLRAIGPAAEVVREYGAFLDMQELPTKAADGVALPLPAAPQGRGAPRLSGIALACNGEPLPDGHCPTLTSRRDCLSLTIRFSGGLSMPVPSVAVCVRDADGRLVSSAGTASDQLALERDQTGNGAVTLDFPELPLLHGDYSIDVYLLCERALLEYDHVFDAARLRMVQEDLVQGVVALPHRWQSPALLEH